jgi:hypothetical protein
MYVWIFASDTKDSRVAVFTETDTKRAAKCAEFEAQGALASSVVLVGKARMEWIVGATSSDIRVDTGYYLA